MRFNNLNLKNQIDTKENELDVMRIRNAKLKKQINELNQERNKNIKPRVIGEILLNARDEPYARLRTGHDENGNKWVEGTPFYAVTDNESKS